MMKIERRFTTHEFRVSQDAAPKIAGYASVFDVNSEDMGFTEIIDSHAFDNVLAAQPNVFALWNHNPDHVLGRTTSGTLKLSVDSRGLAYEIDPPDTTLARDLIVSMKRGDINQSSFGFICKRDQWTDNQDGSITRRILEIAELLDVSPVTYPAFTAATVGVRSLPDSIPVELRSRIDKRGALTQQCTCHCPQCLAKACGICSADPQCEGIERNSTQVESEQGLWLANATLRLRLAESESR